MRILRFLKMMLGRYAHNNAALRCVTFSLRMLQRPSSSFSQTAPFIYKSEKQTNIVPISSLNNSISVQILLEKFVCIEMLIFSILVAVHFHYHHLDYRLWFNLN